MTGHDRRNAARLLLQNALLLAIRFYQLAISPHLPASCRYTPSCSVYAYESIRKYGAVRGVCRAAKRILRCHPLHPGGYDPVR
ncbi:MAG: membrane protein insertion efficiency factor YidD [Treponema sp.]|nr:membrane protein insertion efficiency factor YidD [Treponema sp.]